MQILRPVISHVKYYIYCFQTSVLLYIVHYIFILSLNSAFPGFVIVVET